VVLEEPEAAPVPGPDVLSSEVSGG
jgi:hypothetical protein